MPTSLARPLYTLAGVAVLAAAAPAHAAAPSDTLTFGGTRIWQAVAPGDSGSANDHSPEMSPDGRWIAFTRGYHDRAGIWIAPAAGGPARQLTFPGAGENDWYADWSPDGAQIAFSSTRGGESHVWTVQVADSALRRVTTRPLDLSFQVVQAVWSPDGKDLAYPALVDGNQDIYVQPAAGGPSRRLTVDPAEDAWPDWSPDGRSIAFTSTRQEDCLFVIAAAGGPVRSLPTGQPGPGNPKWSPDGRWIAFRAGQGNANSHNWILDVGSGAITAVAPGDSLTGWFASWSPDGTRLLYTRGDQGGVSDVAVVPVSGGRPRVVGDSAQVSITDHPAWSPDGREVAFATASGGIEAVDLASGRGRTLVAASEAQVSSPAWSPDGAWLAFVSDQLGTSDLWVTPTDRYAPEPVTVGPASDAMPVWSPDGAWLVYASKPSSNAPTGEWNLWRVPLSRDPPQQVLAGNGIEAPVAWTPEGQVLYYASDPGVTRWRLRALELASGKTHTLVDSVGWVGTPSADGRAFVYVADGQIRWRDLASGQERVVVAGGRRPALSPDGRHVAFFPDASTGSYSIWAADVRHIVASPMF